MHDYVHHKPCVTGLIYVRFCRMRVDIIGDSHLHRIRGETFPLDANIVFWSRRGGGVDYLEEAIGLIQRDNSRNISQDIVVVFIGGNDLDAPYVAVRQLANRVAVIISRITRVAGAVAVLKQWPRPGAREGLNYWTNAQYFDYLLPDLLVMNCFTWKWDRTMRFNSSFFARDGVHCQPGRYKKVVRYLASAVLAAIRFLRRRGPVRYLT